MRLRDGATGHILGTLDAEPDWYSSRTVLCGISLDESIKTSLTLYRIYSTLPNSNNRISLLWLPADTAHVMRRKISRKFAAF